MRNHVVFYGAGTAVIVLLAVLALFHCAVLSGIVPQEHVWGGRVAASGSLIFLEIVALIITLLFLFIVVVRVRLALHNSLHGVVRLALWVMTIYFIGNIAGNITSLSGWERAVFTPLSTLLAAGCLILAIGPKAQRNAR